MEKYIVMCMYEREKAGDKDMQDCKLMPPWLINYDIGRYHIRKKICSPNAMCKAHSPPAEWLGKH